MSEARTQNIGSGIIRNSARPIKIVVDQDGEYWICDREAAVSGFDFSGTGCVAHSEVHLVK